MQSRGAVRCHRLCSVQRVIEQTVSSGLFSSHRWASLISGENGGPLVPVRGPSMSQDAVTVPVSGGLVSLSEAGRLGGECDPTPLPPLCPLHCGNADPCLHGDFHLTPGGWRQGHLDILCPILTPQTLLPPILPLCLLLSLGSGFL